MPTAKGVWPAIWLLGNNIDTAPWPLCGEIDLMEFVGYAPDELHFSIHTQDANFKTGGQATEKIKTEMSNKWHVYSTTWTPHRITGEVDGVEYFVRTKAEAGSSEEAWPFDQSFFMILNLAVGGNWGGLCGVDEAAFQGEGQVMEVDWVRVYCSVDEAWCSPGNNLDCNDAWVQANCCNYCAAVPSTPRPPTSTGSCSGSDEGWCSNGDMHNCDDPYVQDKCCNYCAAVPSTPRPPTSTGSCSGSDEGWCSNGDHNCNDPYVQGKCCYLCARRNGGDQNSEPTTGNSVLQSELSKSDNSKNPKMFEKRSLRIRKHEQGLPQGFLAASMMELDQGTMVKTQDVEISTSTSNSIAQISAQISATMNEHTEL